MNNITAHRGSILHFLDHPSRPNAYEFFEDGLLVIEDGHVHAIGSAQSMLQQLGAAFDLSKVDVIEHPNALILPGLIDTHIHYPQAEMICAYGEQLLDWLEQYTFPTELQYADKAYASERAHEVLDLLLSHGTTTALFFCTVHPQSVTALFEVALERNMRIMAGKVMMDRNAPEALLDKSADSSYDESKALIEDWHGKGRLGYAVTPRFAPTSTGEQLAAAGRLLQEYPTVFFQTHLSENMDEIAWVKALFPEQNGYLDVYDHHNLVTDRSLFAHCIHLEPEEWQRLGACGSSIAFCPSSNHFLGSGFFDLERAEQEKIKVSIGTDVGAGSSVSLLNTLLRAYESQQLLKQQKRAIAEACKESKEHSVHREKQGVKEDFKEGFTAFKALYLATLGGARALHLEDKIGNLQPGKEADFIVLNLTKPPLLNRRCQHSRQNRDQSRHQSQEASLHDLLFSICSLSDVSTVERTYILGKEVKK